MVCSHFPLFINALFNDYSHFSAQFGIGSHNPYFIGCLAFTSTYFDYLQFLQNVSRLKRSISK